MILALAGAATAKVALDPAVVGVGARSLAQGRTLAALPGKPDSIFLNPASLSELEHWGATSMFSKLLNQVNYMQLGAARPLGVGTVGLGFLGAGIGGIQTATRDPNTGRITFEAGVTDYYNNIYYLSYGRELNEKLSAGINLKLYSQGFSGGSTGTGYDADLGLTYQVQDYLKVGLVQRNLIPASLGGKIVWSDQDEEALATSTRVGLNFVRGALSASLDYELYPTRPNEKSLIRHISFTRTR